MNSLRFADAKKEFQAGKIVVAITADRRRVVVRDMKYKEGSGMIQTLEGWNDNFRDFSTFANAKDAQNYLMRREVSAAV